MIFSGMTFLFLIGFATTANASSQYLSKLSNDQYLETRQTIHTTNSYFKDLKITIQGTIFQSGSLGKGVKTGKPYVTIDMNNLSWPLRKGIIQSKHGVTTTKYIWAKKKVILKKSECTQISKLPQRHIYRKNRWVSLAR